MKNFLKVMILPFSSAILGILASYYSLNLSFLGLFFLTPFFIFLLKEKRLKFLLWGTFLLRTIWGAGIAFPLFDPILFTFLSLIILGLPFSIYLIRKKWDNQKLILFLMPFLWTLWEYLQARFNLISSFIVTSGNILGSSNFAGLAALGGYLPLIFFCAFTNILLAALIINILNYKKFKFYWKPNLCLLMILIAVIISAKQVSEIQLQKNNLEYQSLKNILKIAAVSNNKSFDLDLDKILVSDQHEKKDIPIQAEIDWFLKLLKKTLLDKKPELLLLPEHFIDLSGLEGLLKIESGKELFKLYQKLSQNLEINLAVVFANYQENQRYNSTFLFNDKGVLIDIYNKRRLMITGEVFPLDKGRSFYTPGKELKIFKVNDVSFASAMCSEIHYPADMKKAKDLGAQFIFVPTSNGWAGDGSGLKEYLFLTGNLRRIMAVWLKIPVVTAGRNDYPGIYLPDGEIKLAAFDSKENKNYGIFFGEIKY